MLKMNRESVCCC